ncbi:hypothetical protein HMPREF9374_2470 [Desmospora sp. 8437]|nr:hypothetical protein HMPREF9374_2470 [Desmospora sp. 8437]
MRLDEYLQREGHRGSGKENDKKQQPPGKRGLFCGQGVDGFRFGDRPSDAHIHPRLVGALPVVAIQFFVKPEEIRKQESRLEYFQFGF